MRPTASRSRSKVPATPKVSTPRESLRELDWSATFRYVALLRERGHLLTIGDIDVDIDQLVTRRFACDCKKCILWRGDAVLVDRSCCARYRIEMTRADRVHLAAVLPLVRKRLPAEHSLQDPDEIPYAIDEDYRMTMNEDERGVCPFVLYRGGLSQCAIHRTCLEEGLDPWTYKPLSCSLWPVASVEYQAGPGRRTLITSYGHETRWLFSDEEQDHCACLLDQHPSCPPLYEAQAEILTRIFGAGFMARLRTAARAHTGAAARRRSGSR
ncbi:MAG TPA: DUF3109 family protein [Polyangia bacterium]|jgi:hypothetical protein